MWAGANDAPTIRNQFSSQRLRYSIIDDTFYHYSETSVLRPSPQPEWERARYQPDTQDRAC